MRRPCSCLILLALLSGACDRGAPSAPPVTASVAPRAATAPVTAPTSAPATTPATTTALGAIALPDAIDKDRVQQLVTRWLAAQNDSDMEAYRALYATRMVGIKRAGARVSNYDARGWFKDREAMQGRGVSVTIEEVEIIPAQASAVVRFRQTWESGKFKDVGVKQLVVVAQDDGELRIAREEMLSSSLLAQGEVGAPPRDAFVHVRHLNGLLAIDLGEAGPGWGMDDDITLIVPEGQVTSRVDGMALPAELAALNTKPFKLYSAEREVCQTRVTGFKLLSDVVPHFGELEHWREERLSEAQIAHRIYELSQGHQRLIGVLQADDRCINALFGRDAALPEPHLYAVSAPDEALTRRLLAAFAKTDGYKAAQREHAEGGGEGVWFNAPANQTLVAKRGDDTLLLIGEEEFQCAPHGSAWTTWRTSSPEELASWREAPVARYDRLPTIDAVVDIDLDGVPELVTKHQVLKLIDGLYTIVLDARPISFDCPC